MATRSRARRIIVRASCVKIRSKTFVTSSRRSSRRRQRPMIDSRPSLRCPQARRKEPAEGRAERELADAESDHVMNQRIVDRGTEGEISEMTCRVDAADLAGGCRRHETAARAADR